MSRDESDIDDRPRPPVEYNPQPLAQLKERYSKALSKLFVLEEVVEGGDRPGLNPANIFDFEDGLRLIVSRDHGMVFGEERVHFSASLRPGSDLEQNARYQAKKRGRDVAMNYILRRAEAGFRQISGVAEFTFIGLSEGKYIPHWVLPAGYGVLSGA